MPGEINLRTDFDGDLADLQKIANGIYTKAELDAAIHSAAMLAAAPLAAGIKIQIGSKRYISAYNETESATVVGEVVVISYSNTYGTVANKAATITASIPVQTAIAMAVIAAAHLLGWFQLSEEAEALVAGDGDAVSAGHYLKVINNGINFVRDGDGAARTVVSAAIAVDATSAAAALKTVILIPERHDIAA